eukprot:500962_1
MNIKVDKWQLTKDDFNLDQNKVKELREDMKQICPGILNPNSGENMDLAQMLYIGQQRNTPYLNLFADLFARESVIHFLKANEQLKEKKDKLTQDTENKTNLDHIIVNELDQTKWLSLNENTSKMQNWSSLKSEYNLLKAALITYYHRLYAMGVFSFHIDNTEEMRCYLYLR